MTPQYQIVNQCLKLLKQGTASRLDALRIETRLIQLKRLLLVTEQYSILDDNSFQELLSGMEILLAENCRRDEVLQYLGQIDGMITTLSGGVF